MYMCIMTGGVTNIFIGFAIFWLNCFCIYVFNSMFNILFHISIFQNLRYVFLSMCLVSEFVPMLL